MRRCIRCSSRTRRRDRRGGADRMSVTAAPHRARSARRIPLGEARVFRVDGRDVAVFRCRSGEVFATSAECPHRGGPLADGLVGGHSVICPLHGFVFDLRTGDGAGPRLRPAGHASRHGRRRRRAARWNWRDRRRHATRAVSAARRVALLESRLADRDRGDGAAAGRRSGERAVADRSRGRCRRGDRRVHRAAVDDEPTR